MSSSEMSPSRASLAAESAANFPLTPTWPGTQSPFRLWLVPYACSKPFTGTGWAYVRLDMACRDERESGKVGKDFLWNGKHVLEPKQ